MFVCVRLGHLVWGEVGSHKRTYVVYEGRGWGVCVTGFSLFVLVCYTCLVCYVEGVGGVYVVGLGSFLPFFNSFSICYLLVSTHMYLHVLWRLLIALVLSEEWEDDVMMMSCPLSPPEINHRHSPPTVGPPNGVSLLRTPTQLSSMNGPNCSSDVFDQLVRGWSDIEEPL